MWARSSQPKLRFYGNQIKDFWETTKDFLTKNDCIYLFNKYTLALSDCYHELTSQICKLSLNTILQ